MDCLCYSRKKCKIQKDLLVENSKKRNSLLEIISSPGKKEISCSYILCEKIGIKPLKKQAVLKNNIYYFCSDICWQEWLKKRELINFGKSPLYSSSPEYMRYFNKSIEIDKIPPLFI